MELRELLLEGNQCTFCVDITADYTDSLYTFQMECIADQDGTLQFTVTEPSSIAGISGSITSNDSALTFDDTILAFPLLADGELTPVSAPWIFIHSLRSGYVTGCSGDDDGIYLYIDDSYEEYPLHLEIKTDENLTPKYVEIIWHDRRVLSMDILNFTVR